MEHKAFVKDIYIYYNINNIGVHTGCIGGGKEESNPYKTNKLLVSN